MREKATTDPTEHQSAFITSFPATATETVRIRIIVVAAVAIAVSVAGCICLTSARI